MKSNELLLQTAFCCMACDGVIANEELEILKKLVGDQRFANVNTEECINAYVAQINSNPVLFIKDYLHNLEDSNLDDEKALELVKLAVDVIESDNEVAYSEVKFFKQVRRRLRIADNVILSQYPEMEDYLLPDVKVPNEFEWCSLIKNIEVEFAL